MSYFEGQTPRWSQHGHQSSWDPAASGSEGASSASQREEALAFGSQYEEVDRARDNLTKSGRVFGYPGNRRDSAPMTGTFSRQYSDFDNRMMNQSRHSIDGMDSMRSHSSHSSSSVPRYIANQRFGPRPNEAESMMHAKRKAAAQRERELRNYHQAQQYNRNLTGAKSDRSTSPNAMNEGDRRELIARQHRALYGNDSNLYMNEGAPGRPMSQDPRALASASGASGSNSMAFDPYATPASAAPAAEPNPSMQAIGGSQSRSRSNSTASPATNQGQFGVYDNPQQIHSQSSPRGSPTRAGAQGPPSGVAPIGTRPMGGKRNTPPMPSPLGYGYPNEKSNQATAERSQSAASNPTSAGADKSVGMGWGGNGAWGSNKMQASVWG